MTTTSPGDGTLELRSVCKRCGTGQGGQVTAADEVTFTIEAAAFVVLTGASGSGKSVLRHMVGAIERPGSGAITVQRRRGHCPEHCRWPVKTPYVSPGARLREDQRAGPEHRPTGSSR